ncbi:hypothetical protein [Fundidesulfovibrio agrisoli]|uniref:hypothetical protein n=1 Tax=Fundidesulfovibrio agrisoli TaxID=2922717 RepID=UPI001FAB6B41|nr:hypothetical protein [Fundidesulfovibrio agrisoli]
MKTEKEFKDNLAAYWRRLNAACGVPAGTHPDDPNPAGTYTAPQAVNPHALSQCVSYLDPGFDAVYASLLSDPEVLVILQDHWNDTFVPNDLGPAPANPHAQLRWYTLRDLNDFHHKRHLADFKDARKHRTRQRIETLLARLKRLDPLFEGTNAVMQHNLEHLPASARRAAQGVFERDPHEVLEFYREMRAVSENTAKIYHNRRIARRQGAD